MRPSSSGLDEETLRRLRHDLRSPLLVISGFAQLLSGERDVSDEERREFATRIQAAADDLRRILDETVG
jgi:signal transduction histidine kinase